MRPGCTTEKAASAVIGGTNLLFVVARAAGAGVSDDGEGNSWMVKS